MSKLRAVCSHWYEKSGPRRDMTEGWKHCERVQVSQARSEGFYPIGKEVVAGNKLGSIRNLLGPARIMFVGASVSFILPLQDQYFLWGLQSALMSWRLVISHVRPSADPSEQAGIPEQRSVG